MKFENNEIYDLVGIGFGPSNLALAAALEQLVAGIGRQRRCGVDLGIELGRTRDVVANR
jgi:hypothetical protein